MLEEIKKELKDIRKEIVTKEYNYYIHDVGLRLVTVLQKLIQYMEEKP